MSPDPARVAEFDWQAAGRQLGARFDDAHAIVVLGSDPVATAHVALGIARAQAAHREVAVGDLLGDAPPFLELVQPADLHGLVDSFTFGVSLNRIATRVPDEERLFILPTGTQSPDYVEILPNARWRRLANGFRQEGALLIIAVPADAPAVERLVDSLDGAILVDDAAPDALPVAQVLGVVRRPRVPVERRSAARPGRQRVLRRVGATVGGVLTATLAGAGLWLAYRPLAGPHGIGHGHIPESTLAKAAIVRIDSVSPPETDSAIGPLPVPSPVDPADSATAVAYSVALTNANTQAGAILNLQENARKLPAATFAPITIQGVRWFRVLAGAYAEPKRADSLLVALRGRGVLDDRSGIVVRAPLAFVIEDRVANGDVPGRLAKYAEQGQPVYPLFQSDGSARLYAGAFESPTQAALYAESLREAGITPVLAYRIGRVF